MTAMVLVDIEPQACPHLPDLFICQACSAKVPRDRINVWQWRSHDHIRAKNTRTAQICDKCHPRPESLEHDPACSEGIPAGEQTMPCDCDWSRPDMRGIK